MHELQLRGAIEASHERGDPWAVRLLQIVGGGDSRSSLRPGPPAWR
jgi:hypothetical protein